MKTLQVLTFLLFISLGAMCQNVAINSTGTVPDTSAMLDISSTKSGLLIPRMTTAQRDAIVTPKVSLMIYNTDTNCYEYYTGATSKWYNFCNTSYTTASGTITGILCYNIYLTGPGASTNSALYNETAMVPYTSGNGGSYAAAAVSSTGVTGLTATLAAGKFNTGDGSLSYVITGTPTTSGYANFSLSIGGQSCSFSLPVNDPQAIQCTTLYGSDVSTTTGTVIAIGGQNVTVTRTVTFGINGNTTDIGGFAVTQCGVTSTATSFWMPQYYSSVKYTFSRPVNDVIIISNYYIQNDNFSVTTNTTGTLKCYGNLTTCPGEITQTSSGNTFTYKKNVTTNGDSDGEGVIAHASLPYTTITVTSANNASTNNGIMINFGFCQAKSY